MSEARKTYQIKRIHVPHTEDRRLWSPLFILYLILSFGLVTEINWLMQYTLFTVHFIMNTWIDTNIFRFFFRFQRFSFNRNVHVEWSTLKSKELCVSDEKITNKRPNRMNHNHNEFGCECGGRVFVLWWENRTWLGWNMRSFKFFDVSRITCQSCAVWLLNV